MIKLTRIDDRLLHGQVALTWTPSLGADCLIVANDKVAADEFQKMLLGMAKPANAKLLIKSVKETVTFLNDQKNATLKILVLINSLADAATLAAEVPEIKSINVGGIRGKDGSRLVSKAVALTEGDISIIRELLTKGIELEVRQVPTDSKKMIESLL